MAVWYREPGHGGPVRHDGVTVVDLDTGSVEDRPLPEYGAGDVQFKLLRIGDRLVFRGSRGRRYGTFSIDSRLEGPAKLIGRSWYFVPSATPGRIWLASLDPRPRESGDLLRGAREVDLSGRVTQRAVRPPDRHLVGSLTNGLVFQGEHRLRVWDPRTRRFVANIRGVFPVAQNGEVIASCTARCSRLVVTDATEGGTRRLPPPPGWKFEDTYDGSFSADGGLVATAVKKGALRRLALVGVDDRRRTIVVPGARLDRGFGVSAWSESGGWVVFNSGGGDLTAYHLESGSLRIFSLGEDHVVMALARGE